MARMTLEQIEASRPKVDRAKIEATTEKDIANHMQEDEENSNASIDNFIEELPSARIRE
jgi:hypothetical protein